MSDIRHAGDNPDPLCEGDDPCVCEQLIEARRQAIRDCIAALPHDTQCTDLWYDDKISECCCESQAAERAVRALLDEKP